MQVAGMTPCESGTLIGRATMPFGPVGAATGANGQFVDNPVGTCANLPFSKNLTGTLTIQMLLNGTYYPVRANNWTESDYQRQRCYSDEVTRETFSGSLCLHRILQRGVGAGACANRGANDRHLGVRLLFQRLGRQADEESGRLGRRSTHQGAH